MSYDELTLQDVGEKIANDTVFATWATMFACYLRDHSYPTYAVAARKRTMFGMPAVALQSVGKHATKLKEQGHLKRSETNHFAYSVDPLPFFYEDVKTIKAIVKGIGTKQWRNRINAQKKGSTKRKATVAKGVGKRTRAGA